MLLSATNLTVRYGAITALQDVSVNISPGEIVALIGANGAGKTTLLRTISGLLKPAAGEITWCPPDDVSPAPRTPHSFLSPGTPGDLRLSEAKSRPVESRGEGRPVIPLDYPGAARDLTTLKPHQIVRLGISHVPEGRQIFANETVKDNLMLGAFTRSARTEIRQNLQRCFELFPVLSERKNQRAGTLSGGEQQMLAIARALMAKPRLLLLDEPSLGLAPLIVKQIFQIIREINQQGATIFLVEQNAHMALRVATRGYVIQCGRVILADTASALLENPEVKRAYLGG
jgi:branched-chain amino acid transport system ATP-binding protein